MNDLENFLERPIVSIEFHIDGDGFRWVLTDADGQTCEIDYEADRIDEIVESTRIVLQMQLDVMPQFIREEKQLRRAAQHPSTN